MKTLVTRHSSLVTALALALASVGASAEIVNIASASDWTALANLVNNGDTSIEVLMTADITLDNSAPSIGTDAHPYAGSFHGAGHTLTLDWDRTGGYAAPFGFTAGCTIEDLHVAGTLKTSGNRAGGLIGRPQPGSKDTVIERCRVSLAIESTFSGEARTGGFIGYTYWSSMNIRFVDCLFDGRLLGTATTHCGGFFGFNSADPHIYLTRCLFDPKEITISSSGSYTFGYPSGSSGLKFSGQSYYTRTFGTAQGTDASSMSAEDLAAVLGDEWTVWGGKAMLSQFAVFEPPSPAEPAVAGFVYQGALRGAQGQALAEKRHTIEFRLYAAAAGGRALWTRAYPVLLDDDGLFNVALHDAGGEAVGDETATGLAGILAANAGTTLYVGLTVAGSGAEISPRQKLLSAPYATYAADLFAAKGGFAAAGRLSAGAAKSAGLLDAASLSTSGAATVGGDVAVGGAITGLGTMPLGGIVLWKGSVGAIPDGWALCNGQRVNGRTTPDLRNRFVVGAGNEYSVGSTGGAKTVAISEDQLPSHRHSYTFHGADLDLSWDGDNYFYDASDHYNRDKNKNTKYTGYAGGDAAHENRPPYYALCYIMRVR